MNVTTTQLAKEVPYGIHLTEPANRRPTGMSDIVRFHSEYQDMDEANAEPSDSPSRHRRPSPSWRQNSSS